MQKIVQVRIDERLIHGQVASFWTSYLGANRIMVIDNNAVKDNIQKTALKMACPPGVKLSILSTGKAAENLLSQKYKDEKIFIVLKGPEVLLELREKGLNLDEVNVGNMSSGRGTTQVKKSVNVTEEDVKNFHKLEELGVTLYAQMVPNDDRVNFSKLIESM